MSARKMQSIANQKEIDFKNNYLNQRRQFTKAQQQIQNQPDSSKHKAQ